jgi:hypothetical protein
MFRVHLLWSASIAAAVLVACGGKDEEEAAACDQFTVTVNVVDVAGDPEPEALVKLIAVDPATNSIVTVDCTGNGDGSFACATTSGLERYQVSASHPAFSSAAQGVVLGEDPCSTPVTVDLQLGVMMGA